MAKKRKTRGSKKEVSNRQELPSGFGRQVFALVLIVLAVLFVLAMLGAKGTALNAVFEGGRDVIGHTMFVLPLALIVLAVLIFRKDDHRLPFGVWSMMIILLLVLSGLFGLPTLGEKVSTGGLVGGGLDKMMVAGVGVPGAAVIYVFIAFVALMFVFAKSPAAFFKWWWSKLHTTKQREDERNAAVARKAEEKPGELKINAGVAMVSEAERQAGKKEEKAAAPREKALVAVNDPNWKLPGVNLLETRKMPADAGNIRENSLIIKNTLAEFDIDVEMDGANVGPRVTQYTMKPANGVKLAKIMNMDRELTRSLAADKIRIEAPIPGTNLVGVEIPNIRQADVSLREIVDSGPWRGASGKLMFAVGKDIAGEPVMADLAKMPHLLIAGTTGSGKSVMMNTLLLSLLYRNTPADMRLIIIDPKQVEMASYSDIRHLLTPIITNVEGALSSLSWAVKEMEKRYKEMAKYRVKNIGEYNAKIDAGEIKVEVPDEEGHEQRHDGGKMPYIVIVVDEMADLMMMAGKDLESLIVRAAQKGRAAGIHLVLATQRPEVKVITGLIKANIPGRIAFAVGSQIDSRVMLDMNGAEKLLGKGDMLFLTTEMMGKPMRVQGAFASEPSKNDPGDIERVTNFLRDQAEPDYNEDVANQRVSIKGSMGTSSGGGGGDLSDPLIRDIMEFALEQGRLSNSDIMRKFGLGFQRAGRMIDNLEDAGMIGGRNGNKPREILISSIEEFDERA
jgi:S-DNA-T family DNA segregation ATPase FtsK/SpoIIIE